MENYAANIAIIGGNAERNRYMMDGLNSCAIYDKRFSVLPDRMPDIELLEANFESFDDVKGKVLQVASGCRTSLIRVGCGKALFPAADSAHSLMVIGRDAKVLVPTERIGYWWKEEIFPICYSPQECGINHRIAKKLTNGKTLKESDWVALEKAGMAKLSRMENGKVQFQLTDAGRLAREIYATV